MKYDSFSALKSYKPAVYMVFQFIYSYHLMVFLYPQWKMTKESNFSKEM